MDIRNVSKGKEETINAKDVVGAKVLDSRGKDVGKVKTVHISPVELRVEGITLSHGVFQGKNYIGRDYIANLSKEAAILTMTPLTEYLGMEVYDKNGVKIGKVKDVYRTRKTNSVLSMTIDRGFTDHDVIVTSDQIGSVGENVLLNIPMAET